MRDKITMPENKIIKSTKTYTSDNTRFKLVCYYSHRPCGTPYSVLEQSQKKHRKYHDSYDYIPVTGGRTLRREDLGLNKLLHFVETHKAHIHFALLYVNDFTTGEQYLMGKFFKDETRSIFVAPNFRECDLGTGHVYFDGLQSEPIEVSKIQQVTFKKNAA